MPSSFTVAGCAVAAKSLGYLSLAEMILDGDMQPAHIARLFTLSGSKTAAHDCAVVLFAGSVARYRAAPQRWDGHIEEQLVREVLASGPKPTVAFRKASSEAVKLVARHWQTIA